MRNSAEGKLIYLLLLTVAVQFLFPLSISDDPIVLIIYQLFYVSLFIVGSWVVGERRRFKQIMLGLTISWVIFGITFAFNQDLQWANLAAYAVLAIFQGMLIYSLLRFIFGTPIVTRDVLYAACIIYLLLGAVFVLAFGFIETLTWFPEQTTHAFADGANSYPNEVFPWQTLVYYSYTNLTTLGYGDVLPITPWARSVATFEAVVGVLYLTIIMARLVGLYAAEEVEDAHS